MARVHFTGYVDLDLDGADDRGTVDIWLINAIADTIKEGPETDDIYEKLSLEWEVADEEGMID